MKPPKRLNFARDAAEWYRSLTFAQSSDVSRWLSTNLPPPDWKGTLIEWAYLSMPVPEGW